MKKVLITGGHLTPAIAVADQLTEQSIAEIVWVGTAKTTRQDANYSSEYKAVTNRGYKFTNLETGKLFRKWNSYTYKDAFLNLALIPIGFLKSMSIINQERPNLVMSFGGYIAVPIAIWAWIYKIPVLTHEQTVVSGLANRIVAIFAKQVLISWDFSKNDFKSDKTILTGNPIPKVFIDVYKEEGRKLFDNDLKTVFITGGNQGSHRINETIKPILKALLKNYNVIHQCGGTSQFRDFDELSDLYKSFSNKGTGKYLLYEFDLSIEHARHYKYSDVVISRSGANTMSNLILFNKKCILIPIPWASKNEQYLNARIIEDMGLGTIIPQSKLAPEVLLNQLDKVINKDNPAGKAEKDVSFITQSVENIIAVIRPYL